MVKGLLSFTKEGFHCGSSSNTDRIPGLALSPAQNTVDILVGWHIDIQQEASLIDFISHALVSLHDFWIKDMSFSVELLKQFLEDMEAYSSVSAGLLECDIV